MSSIQKKYNAGKNAATKTDVNTLKIDLADNVYEIPKVTLQFSQALQKARIEKGLTQIQLANQISEKPSTITSYENGTAIPSGPILQKLQKVLKTQLPKASNPKRYSKDDNDD